MPRRLKTYRTSAGFFDLAVAAPSMKAALEAWGSRANLFHQGFASETHDPAIVAATMAKPGVVLRRPVGTSGAFREEARLPTTLPASKPKARKKAKAKAKKQDPRNDDGAARQAAITFERERRRREAAQLKEEQAQERAQVKRERAIATAEAALDKARRQHERRRDDIERRARAEDARWAKQRTTLETALRRARHRR